MYRRIKINNSTYKDKEIKISNRLNYDDFMDIGDWDEQYPELKILYNSHSVPINQNSHVVRQNNFIIGYAITDNVINLDDNPYIDKYSRKLIINDIAIYSRRYSKYGKLLIKYIYNFALNNYCKAIEIKKVEGFDYFYSFLEKKFKVSEYNGSFYIVIKNPKTQSGSAYLRIYEDDDISLEDLYFLYGLKFTIYRHKCVYYSNGKKIISVDRNTKKVSLPENVSNRYDNPLIDYRVRKLIYLLCSMYNNDWVSNIYFETNKEKALVDAQTKDFAVLFDYLARNTNNYELINKILMTHGYNEILVCTCDFEYNSLIYNSSIYKVNILEFLSKPSKFIDLHGLSLMDIKGKLEESKVFNSKLEKLLRFDFRMGNSFSGIKKFTILFEDDIIIKYNGAQNEDVLIEKNTIINELKNMYFSNWAEKYVALNPNQDNCWSVSLVFEDETLSYTGVDKYPNVWPLLVNFIEKYSSLIIRGEDKEINY